MKRFFVSLFAGQLLLFLSCGLCFAEKFKFDPASCKESTGSLYIALGRYVFVSPVGPNMVIDPSDQDDDRLKVPNPSEPLGCFGNPLQSDSHYLFHSMAFAVDAPGHEKPIAADRLSLHKLEKGGKDNEWAAEQFANLRVETSCGHGLRESLVSGLDACRIKPADAPNSRQENWAATYIARAESYTTPLGRPFIIDCGPGLWSTGLGKCEVAYVLKPGLGVAYEFRPYRTRYPIPIDQAIPYDKSLREAIERSLVKDYPWPQ